MRAAVILGAGWSYVAGLPLAQDLLSRPRFYPSQTAAQHGDAVLRCFADWREEHADAPSELFVQAAYRGELDVPWPWVAEFLLCRLANPVAGDRRAHTSLRYGQRITTRTYCPIHTQFWLDVVDRYELSAVATTNYDLLAERSLRHRPVKRPPLPGFHYGGFRGQPAIGQAQPWTVTDPQRVVTPTGRVPLFKLHGSLNWALSGPAETRSDPSLPLDCRTQPHIYQDLRPAFRQAATAAIVPPLPHKEAPLWLRPVWEAAAARLSETHLWLVVGYSLPDYDIATRDLISQAARAGVLSEVHLHDPRAAAHVEAWSEVTGGVRVLAAPALPRC